MSPSTLEAGARIPVPRLLENAKIASIYVE